MNKEKKYIPTFDGWFQRKHMGLSFESQYILPHHDFKTAMMSLTKEIREYISEVVQDGE